MTNPNNDPTSERPKNFMTAKKLAVIGIAATAAIGLQLTHDQLTDSSEVAIYNPLTWVASPIDTIISNVGQIPNSMPLALNNDPASVYLPV
jgi:hypothetical protein